MREDRVSMGAGRGEKDVCYIVSSLLYTVTRHADAAYTSRIRTCCLPEAPREAPCTYVA